MEIKLEGNFKSLSSFNWRSDSHLSILTGENGSGKSQFLEMLKFAISSPKNNDGYYQYSDADPKTGKNRINYFKLDLQGFYPPLDNYVHWSSYGKYLHSFPISYTYYLEFINWLFIHTKEDKNRLSEQLNIHIIDNQFQPRHSQSSSGFESTINGKHLKNEIINKVSQSARVPIGELKIQDFLSYLPINFIFNSINFAQNDLIEHYVFFYHMQKLMREHFNIEIDSLGEDPIIVLNRILLSCGLRYTVEDFDSKPYKDAKGADAVLKSLDPFILLAKKYKSDALINFQEVSTGERIIVCLGLLEYFATYMKKTPALMLLDEIDAHLHPALIPNLFRVVNDLLINKFNTLVIMTTHNPSTIALAPKSPNSSVFRISNEGETKIMQDNSKNFSESMNLLCQGLLVVNEATKFIFVEDEDDENFYNNINKVNSISSKLVFIPASNRIVKDNQTEIYKTGGKDAVNKWLERFGDFNGVFNGLIDRDAGNEEYSNNLKLIERYSIENYYCDPLVLFAYLNSLTTRKSEIEKFDIIKGKEHEIHLNHYKADEIINFIISKLEPFVLAEIDQNISKNQIRYSKPISSSDHCKNKVEVEYQNGVKYKYPEWLLYYRGKSLLNACQQAFGHRPGINELIRPYNYIGLYPKELIVKLRSLL